MSSILSNLKQFNPSYENDDECPACPKEKGSLFISIDALFGCVQKCSAGTNGKSSNHGEELFINQEKVDAFPANYSKRPSGKSTVCKRNDFFSYFVCCCFTLTFCYPSVLIPLLNHCNERPKVTVMFVAGNNDVSVVLFKYSTV
ncbi:uncharacterized protein LOC113679567 [Pocillopora damicornis]|uniref:uncharacterized protein LOC113679567 n=1 Tax=Pocillopora damicornis TaxID=46731 RepID=UPI000F559A75|nr:uncharacterized protein LOC113679567 [Pocillopora damicornis]